MTRSYDHKELYGGASFPAISEGLFLFTSTDGEVVGINIPWLSFARFIQPTPDSRWHFEHNLGFLPFVQVYNEEGQVITESVLVRATDAIVTIETENGVLVAGSVILMGTSGMPGGGLPSSSPSNGGSPGSGSTPPPAQPGTGIRLTGTPFGTPGSHGNDPLRTFGSAFDGNEETFVDTADADKSSAFCGLDFGANRSIKKIRFLPRRGEVSRMRGGRFECSLDGTNYTLIQVLDSVIEGWNEISVDAPPARYVRYTAPPNSWGNVAEIEFYS
jgi:hypothetical protein